VTVETIHDHEARCGFNPLSMRSCEIAPCSFRAKRTEHEKWTAHNNSHLKQISHALAQLEPTLTCHESLLNQQGSHLQILSNTLTEE